MTRIIRFAPLWDCRGYLVPALLALSLPAGISAAPSGSVSAGVVQTRAEIEATLRARGLTIRQLQDMVQQGGMSLEDIRRRIADEGYDPDLVGELFPEVFGTVQTGAAGENASSIVPSYQLLEALESAGLLTPLDVPSAGSRLGDEEAADARGDAADAGAFVVFGSDVFRRGVADPLLNVPVGRNYILGAGDRILFVLTGDIEEVHDLAVTREGMLIMPRVGEMAVSGLSLGALEDRVEQRLRTTYGDVGRDSRSRIRFSVAIGRIRNIQVQVLGAVVSPGSHFVSAAATVIDALYNAGGPTDRGSYRQVRLIRDNDVIETDLYPYITSGGTGSYPGLRDGDVVHVPWVGKQVVLRGEVRNPALYELRGGESLADVLDFAGGILPTGRANFAKLTRILPPDERSRLADRTFIDVPLDSVLAGAVVYPLEAGDDIEVQRIRMQIENQVAIEGAVSWPGAYEIDPGMTLGDLFHKAGGGNPDAVLDNVLIMRQPVDLLSRTLIRHDLEADPIGPRLVDRDEIIVFSKGILRQRDSVAISGVVVQPGMYPFITEMTAGDLVLMAGGFKTNAMTREAEVVRIMEETGTRHTVYTPIRPSVAVTGESEAIPLNVTTSRDVEIPLLPNDHVFIRRRADHPADVAIVSLAGEFSRPGDYILETSEERLSSVIARAGGFSDRASREIRLVRAGIVVSVAEGDQELFDDPVLTDGDLITAEPEASTVRVAGAVVFPTEFVFRSGMTLDDGLSQAGGLTQTADRDGVSVSYPDGSRATAGKTLGLFRSDPPIRAGAAIWVPEKDVTDEGIDWGQVTSSILQLVSATATLIIAANSTR